MFFFKFLGVSDKFFFVFFVGFVFLVILIIVVIYYKIFKIVSKVIRECCINSGFVSKVVCFLFVVVFEFKFCYYVDK